MQTLPLHLMTRQEKLLALETLWADLTRSAEAYESPAWHADELAATAQRVSRGEDEFTDWSAARQALHRRVQ